MALEAEVYPALLSLHSQFWGFDIDPIVVPVYPVLAFCPWIAPRILRDFLSCLHGSERNIRGDVTGIRFLSCLHGSELVSGNVLRET